MVKISVLIPVYNVERYLSDCLNSILRQSLKDIEIICINDGSTDKSSEILYQYANRDNRIRIIDKENGGYGSAMNCGLKAAQGEYIGVVESDDFISPLMFERLYYEAKRNDAEVVKSNYWMHNDQGDVFFELLKGYKYYTLLDPSEEELLLCKYVNLWSGIYKRDFLNMFGIVFNETPGASYQDVGFTVKTMACAKRVFLIHDAFYYYRVDNPDASVKSKDKPNCVFDEFDSVWGFLKCHKKEYDAVKYIIPVLQFMRVSETYNRVGMEHKAKLLGEIKNRYSSLDEQGLLNKDYWLPKLWDVMRNVGNADFQRFEDRQKRKFEITGFWNEVSLREHLYIYGAGRVAEIAIERLQEKNIIPLGCVVTDTKRNPSYIKGIPVISVDEIREHYDNVTVVIAVKDSDQISILTALQAKGFSNIISFNKCLREKFERWDEEKKSRWKDEMMAITRWNSL